MAAIFIGVMKAFGARRRQIGGIYLATVLILGALALVIGIPAGIWAGRTYANFAASIRSTSILIEQIRAAHARS